MEILWTVVKFLIANVLLVFISSTLIGNTVRGIVQPRVKNYHGYHKAEYYSISPTKGIILSLISTSISVFVLIILYRYTNIYVFVGFLSWMLTRIKDLLGEIKTGIKTTNRTMKSSPVDHVLTAISWIGFGVFNYGLYLYWIE